MCLTRFIWKNEAQNDINGLSVHNVNIEYNESKKITQTEYCRFLFLFFTCCPEVFCLFICLLSFAGSVGVEASVQLYTLCACDQLYLQSASACLMFSELIYQLICCPALIVIRIFCQVSSKVLVVISFNIALMASQHLYDLTLCCC